MLWLFIRHFPFGIKADAYASLVCGRVYLGALICFFIGYPLVCIFMHSVMLPYAAPKPLYFPSPS